MVFKSTKIVATLGPASDSKEVIEKLYKAGMNVARLNFSHGAYEYFTELIKNIREVSDEIAILLDTKGPEIRTGDIKDGSVRLEDNQDLIFTSEEIVGDSKKVFVRYPKLSNLDVGNFLLIDDGLIETEVIEKLDGGEIKVRVLNGGVLGSKKTVTIRGHSVDIPFLSEKDKQDILYGIEQGVDFVAASFVRKEEEVIELRELLDKNGGEDIKIISKIEHGEAVDNFDKILYRSQGIMVARGDLGVEIPLEKVPGIQAEIIRKCNELGRPVIVATQMLESMKDNPRPTRAEVGDVATAILQGTDAVMLSGETASGKYPVKSVKAMAAIAKEYDCMVKTEILDNMHTNEYLMKNEISMFVTKAAFLASQTIKTRAILAPTESGYTARKVSRFKPKCPIFAISPHKFVIRQLAISWGVVPMYEEKEYCDLDEMINDLVIKCMDKDLLDEDDNVVITGGHKMSRKGLTNILEIFKVKCIADRIKGIK